MNIFIEGHLAILKTLIEHKVNFMLVGGYAVIFHGYRRTTGDLDLWLEPDNENKNRLHKALTGKGFEKEGLDMLLQADFTKHLVFSIGMEPQKIDFLTHVNLVSYPEADSQKVMAAIDGISLPIIHLNHLYLTKINTGRPQDKTDVETLQRIRQERR